MVCEHQRPSLTMLLCGCCDEVSHMKKSPKVYKVYIQSLGPHQVFVLKTKLVLYTP